MSVVTTATMNIVSTMDLNIKKIGCTVTPTPFTKNIINAVKTCPLHIKPVTFIKTKLAYSMSFDIHTDDEVITVCVPHVDFDLNFEDNTSTPIIQLVHDDIDNEMTLSDAVKDDDKYDIHINGYSLFDSLFNEDSEDEFHRDPNYSVIVSKARMLNANIDNIIKFARSKADYPAFADRYYTDYSHIFKILRFALQVCGIKK